jgi:hypothetical protein
MCKKEWKVNLGQGSAAAGKERSAFGNAKFISDTNSLCNAIFKCNTNTNTITNFFCNANAYAKCARN